MIVLFFIDSLRSGGKERQLIELIKGLCAIDAVTCELVTMSEEIHYDALDNLPVKKHFLIRKCRKDPLIVAKLYQLCRSLKPDIIHSWGSMCSVYAVPVAKLLGIKFINGYLRNTPQNFSWRHAKWLRSKLTFPFSDAIVSNSQAGLYAYNAPESKRVCIHNGFDFSRTESLEAPESIRATYAITTQNIVGMVASFSKNKDYATFLAAAQEILKTRDDVTFVAIGDGPDLETEVNNLNHSARPFVKFLGRQKDIESIVHVFTVGVLASSSHGEGISNTIMEYMALSKPVVATDCGGNRELVIDGETGFLVRTGDAEELASKITQLLDTPSIALSFGQRGHERLRTKFNLDRMCQDYLALYHKVSKN